ncbi:glycoside hydrolase family 28 protein [Sphingobacterium faecium]|jgi:polygalacturonase|uniref:glycoside hydrolase family 28 protein n=1 Tax=Sphingobacterium faecium TaxID=34087 RepID=UPI0004E5F890|nr:glycoside hydrolase family 28 protein [Sphingobacterium faecium]CDS92377.1 Exo-poly-alpha-D-galacturonosidase [Sphingobacterium sp. PM2-P1-29]SJN33745.1 Polygalacturonase [Sphingobacterium faecium PCAi_F2.5]HCU45074.1 glycoside hydrolase family 28 protein [Sphingobacterium sp.]UXD68954.1 glycoside hydrolase family 28 protein [Sphingobacterium faecium]WGQ16666.1 glycoside hydrolase family 28 protein [Sphingobacterium faecium]
MRTSRNYFSSIKKGILAVIVLSGSSVFAQAPQPPVVQTVSFRSDTINIVNHGAKGDGHFLNTTAINKAIEQSSLQGGGVVLVPSGLWLTGPIILKSNVNLHLKRDAILFFTDDFDQYKLIAANWEGQPAWRNQSPISGTDLTNIAITGSGVIDGNGDAWRMVKKSKLTDSQWKNLVNSGGVVDKSNQIWYPSEKSLAGSKDKKAGVMTAGTSSSDYEHIKDFLRPNLLVLTNCKKVLLEGVTIQNSPAWNLHPLLCEDLTLRRLLVRNPWYGQNGDGVDIESCKNVLIEDCTFDVGDDGICIKSGRDKSGRERGKPTENVLIRNNVVYHAHGGFVIGSEMSGGAKNIWVQDCSFIGTDIGLRFKTKRGRGGTVENIFIENINMIDIPGEAILFDMYYEAVDPVPMAGEKREKVKAEKIPVTEETPQFKNFHIKNVFVNGAEKGIFFRGLPEMNIQDITIEKVTIQAKKGIDIIEASNIKLKDITIFSKETTPVVHIENAQNIVFENLKYQDDATLLFDLYGENSKNIQVIKTDVNKAKTISKIASGLSKSVLKIKK